MENDKIFINKWMKEIVISILWSTRISMIHIHYPVNCLPQRMKSHLNN
jgi:hypothetical protein